MKKIFLYGVVAFASFSFSSCSTPTNLYSWYNYDNLVYEYNKEPSEKLQLKVIEEYQKMMDKQKGTRKIVPPGMNAEYGYLLVKLGKKEEGLALLRQEIKLYPESEKYISRIIKQLEK